jgi:predicted short-subunit dehydrogenase-like oxidoreductase (DUF2520 family)
MAAKPRIAIVGAGKLGSALALALYQAGYRIDVVIARSRGESLRRAKRLANQTRSRAVVAPEHIKAHVLWLCVPDSEVQQVAQSLAPGFLGKVALHSSGALSSDELKSLRKKGAAVASVHPLMTFVQRSQPPLTRVPFAIEGDRAAVRTARVIVQDLGGECYSIRKDEKGGYHAWATFASPLLTTLLATAEQVAALAGVKSKAARRRMLPILLQTVRNYADLGAAAGFSGPIIRGDVETLRRHLRVLRKLPVARQLYLALARAALEYLPARNRRALRRLLTSA